MSLLFGLLTAAMWATATLCSSRSVRRSPQTAVVAWVMLVGLVETLPLVVADGVPAQLAPGSPDPATLAWLAVAGAGNVVGLLLAYAGLGVGKVGIVAPIVAAEGAVAALISILAGERVTLAVGTALALVATGVVISALAPDTVGGEPRPGVHPVRGALFAVGAATVFGCSLFASGHLSTRLPASWIVLAPRLVGVLAIAVPLAVRGGLAIPRPVLPLVLVSGTAEVLGFFTFTQGSRHGVAVTAVIASQFAPLAALAAFLLFRERLGRVQLVGVALLVLGVSATSVVTQV